MSASITHGPKVQQCCIYIQSGIDSNRMVVCRCIAYIYQIYIDCAISCQFLCACKSFIICKQFGSEVHYTSSCKLFWAPVNCTGHPYTYCVYCSSWTIKTICKWSIASNCRDWIVIFIKTKAWITVLSWSCDHPFYKRNTLGNLIWW